MSLTAAQRSRAASAYRAMLRASAATFAGDAPVLAAFRLQNRAYFDRLLPHRPSPAGAPPLPPSGFDAEVSGAFEAALFLRRNVVQGRRSGDGQRLELRITKDTELGDNSSIKTPTAMPASAGGCCSGGEAQGQVLSEAAQARRERRRAKRLALQADGATAGAGAGAEQPAAR